MIRHHSVNARFLLDVVVLSLSISEALEVFTFVLQLIARRFRRSGARHRLLVLGVVWLGVVWLGVV